MHVQVLAFEGCPNAAPAVQLARDAAAEIGADTEIEIVHINDLSEAQAHHFLGSPSIRVDGGDVELGAGRRPASYSCRIYHGAGGPSGLPDRQWVVAAIRNAAQFA